MSKLEKTILKIALLVVVIILAILVIVAIVVKFRADEDSVIPATINISEIKGGAVSYKVYKEAKGARTLVLEVTNEPGPIVSTAILAPGGSIATNPFLSATSYDATEENTLGTLLGEAKSFSEFMSLLQKNGYILEKEIK